MSSNAGARSYYRLQAVIQDISGMKHFIRGVRIFRRPKYLRHVTCECAWV